MTVPHELADGAAASRMLPGRRRFRLRIAASILLRDIVERAQFDWRWSRELLARALMLASYVSRLLRQNERELDVLGILWRSFGTVSASELAEARLLHLRRSLGRSAVAATCRAMLERRGDADAEAALRASISEPRPFDKRLLILKAPDEKGKGVLVIKYTNYFKHFLRVFDLGQMAKDYHLVLEPSWIGFYLPEIMTFESLAPDPVFVQTWEDRDRNFLDSLGTNLRTVPLSPNAWTNPKLFMPNHDAEKIYDAIIVSVWADYKRHFALFRALREAKNESLRIVCVGEPWPRSLSSIREEAEHLGVGHQVEFFDSLSHEQLGALYARSRIALLLSRKEGPNKAIVEAMFAGTPAFLRQGFNYGTQYPYICAETGGFFEESELPSLLLDAHAGRFSAMRPDKWVRAHWNPVSATRTLEESIFGARTNSLHVKVNSPDLDYLDESSWATLADAYRDLPRYVRWSVG